MQSPPALPFSERPRTSLSSSRTASAFHASRSPGSWEKRAETQEALGGHRLSPLSPCTHVDFLLGAEARLGPCMWGGCLQLQGLWEERLWGLGGRGPLSSWAGWVPFQLACSAFLPTQAQPGGGGGCSLHEDLPLSQDLAPSVSSLQARLCGTGVRPEFQHLGREGIVPGVWGGLDPISLGLIF